MIIAQIILALCAAYCGITYLRVADLTMRGGYEPRLAELHTFHLGLCFILAIGFLALSVGH
jgi:hypothetical protein